MQPEPNTPKFQAGQIGDLGRSMENTMFDPNSEEFRLYNSIRVALEEDANSFVLH